MSLQDATQKVRPEHVKKLAYVYVRQSTLKGVKENIAGGQRQYDVYKLALQLGWSESNIRIVDEDQARSGSTTEGRYGYVQMFNDVCAGLVGAVFSLEPARVGRDTADWHVLIKMCDHSGTLVIDPDGIYDASDLNDNTMMKFKALMAEMELRWITSRLLGAKRALAEKGELRTFLTVGYIYDEDNKLIFDPDEDVQKMVRLLFTLFRQLRSASKVVRYFNENGLTFPTVVRGGPRKGRYTWKPLTTTRVYAILHNPVYSGTYVYGRSKTKKKVVQKEGEAPKVVKYQEALKREDWQFVLHDAHPAYITWEEFVLNEQLLEKNRNVPGGGAPRAGSALLHGLARCGKCGQGMRVSYPHDPSIPYYTCIHKRVNFGGSNCQTLPGDMVNLAVEQAFLDTLKPAQVEMSLEALGRAEEQAREADRQWAARLKRAKAAVAEAGERLLAVDTKNKRAFARVQQDMETKEDELEILERERAEEKRFVLEDISPEERGKILAFAQDFPGVWHADTTDMVAKKNLLRCLIEDVTLTREGRTIHVGIRWKTQAHTALTVKLPAPGFKLRLPEPVLELIRKLAPTQTDRQIATALNDARMLNGRGQPFTKMRVKRVRERYDIKKHPLDDFPDTDYDGRYSSAAVARMLGVHTNTVLKLCREGRLDGVKDKLEQRWWIKITPGEAEEMEKTIRRWPSRSHKRADLSEIIRLSALLGGESEVDPKGVAL
jgi:DNA invertase Pin-like site-specific DNA recombinase